MYKHYNDVCNTMPKLNKKKLCKIKLHMCYIVLYMLKKIATLNTNVTALSKLSQNIVNYVSEFVQLQIY